jgi:hypothetical protein
MGRVRGDRARDKRNVEHALLAFLDEWVFEFFEIRFVLSVAGARKEPSRS